MIVTSFQFLLKRCLLCVLISLMAANYAHAQSQLVIESDDWGFDGRVVPQKFNLLTLTVRNVSGKQFSGTIQLTRNQGGARIIEPVTVSPYGNRLVQFYPFIGNYVDTFEVVWGNTLDDRHTVEEPSMSAGSRVIVEDPQLGGTLQVSLKGFREDYFPPTVIGTDSLRVAVLDHLPRWQTPQREAFRDWLYAGGQLHMIHGPDGDFPESPVPELNAGRPTSFGSGRVFWHSVGRAGLNRTFCEDVVFRNSQPAVKLVDYNGEAIDSDPTLSSTRRSNIVDSNWDGAEVLSMRLKEAVPVKHSWGLIFLFSFLYVGVIFPGGWLFSLKVSDYRINLLVLLAVVGLTSFLFSSVGARGYGEKTSTHSLTIAKPLPDGFWDIQQVNSVFVTNGATYSIKPPGDVAAFSAAQQGESVKGTIENGRNPRFTVDIPPFTFRSFLVRSKVKMPELQFRVKSAAVRSRSLKSVALIRTGTLPAKIYSAILLHDDDVYEVNLAALQSRGNILARQSRSTIRSLFALNLNRSSSTEMQTYRNLRNLLMAQNAGMFRNQDGRQYKIPKGQAKLLIYARLPAALNTLQKTDVGQKSLGKQAGRVLYTFDLKLPDIQNSAAE